MRWRTQRPCVKRPQQASILYALKPGNHFCFSRSSDLDPPRTPPPSASTTPVAVTAVTQPSPKEKVITCGVQVVDGFVHRRLCAGCRDCACDFQHHTKSAARDPTGCSNFWSQAVSAPPIEPTTAMPYPVNQNNGRTVAPPASPCDSKHTHE